MSALYYKGENINTAPITPVVSIMQAEYNSNKTYYDSLDSIIEITDSTNNGGNASNIKYGTTDVSTELDKINSNVSNLNTLGTIVNGTLYSSMASTQAWQKVAEITLPKGRWLLIGSCQYTSLAQAGLSLSRTTSRTMYCVDAQADLLQISGVFTLSTEETLYLIAHHNDTDKQTIPQDFIAVKIAN